MDKLKKIYKRFFFGEKNKLNLYILIAGIIVAIIFVSEFVEKKPDKKKKVTHSHEEVVYDDLEERLSGILSEIDGAGRVKVMITYEETSEKIPLSDKTNKSLTTEENNSGSLGRKQIQTDTSDKTVILSEGGGTNDVFVSKEIYPKVRGVIISCSGAPGDGVKAEIVNAVSCVLGVAIHKIAVF